MLNLVEKMSTMSRLLKYKPSYVQALGLVGIVLMTKGFSFAKEVIFARYLGTSIESDYYKLLLTFFNFAVGILAANSLRPAFTPAYLRLKRADPEASARFSSQVLLLVLVLAMLFFLTMNALAPFLFSGWLKEYRDIGDNYILYILLSFAIIVIFSLSSHFRNILHADGYHLSAEFMSVISAIGSLVGVFFYQSFGLVAIAVGYSSGIFIELLCLIALTLHHGDRVFPRRLKFADKSVMKPFYKQWLYASSMSTLMSGTMFTDRIMAKYVGEGSVSVLDYAQQFISVFLTLGLTSIGSILLTKFSQAIVADNFQAVKRIMRQSEIASLTLGFAFVLFLSMFSEELVQLVYERGQFTHVDTVRVASAQIFYSFQVPFHLTGIIYARHLSAHSANGVILCISLFCLILNVTLNYILMSMFGVSGIALSTSFVYAVSFVLLRHFSKKFLAANLNK